MRNLDGPPIRPLLGLRWRYCYNNVPILQWTMDYITIIHTRYRKHGSVMTRCCGYMGVKDQ